MWEKETEREREREEKVQGGEGRGGCKVNKEKGVRRRRREIKTGERKTEKQRESRPAGEGDLARLPSKQGVSETNL